MNYQRILLYIITILIGSGLGYLYFRIIGCRSGG